MLPPTRHQVIFRRSHSKIEREVIMKKSLATSFGKAAAFSAIALAVSAALAQDAERIRPLSADVKINKQLQITGQPPAGYNPQFTFNVNVTENELPKPPEGCRWEKPTYQPPGGNTTATTGGAAQVTVINHLVCRPRTKCDDAQSLSVSLAGLSQWTNPSGPAFVNAYKNAWVPNGGNVSWVGFNANGSAGPSLEYDAQIKFCACPKAEVRANVQNYRADDRATLSMTPSSSAPIQAGTFPTSGAGAIGSLLSINGPNPTNYLLNNHIKNAGGPTGWTMTGMLTVNKGYLGACQIRADNPDPTQ